MMIEIEHRKLGDSASNLCNKMEEFEIGIDINLIDKDIERLKGEIGKTNNEFDNKNIKALIKYLEGIKKKVKDDKIEMCWHTDTTNVMSSYPIAFISEPLYAINTYNYVLIEQDEKIMILNVKDMSDIIAYEFIYRDLGEDHDTVEELLRDCNIIAYSDAKILTDKFKADGDDMYSLAMSMRIGESSYCCRDHKTIFDYFNAKEFNNDPKTSKYKEVVQYSCKQASMFVTSEIIKKCISLGIKYKLLMTNEKEIVIVIDESKHENVERELINDISIQAFGRNFILEKKLTIL